MTVQHKTLAIVGASSSETVANYSIILVFFIATSGIAQSDLGSILGKGQEILLFSIVFSLAFWPTQSPV